MVDYRNSLVDIEEAITNYRRGLEQQNERYNSILRFLPDSFIDYINEELDGEAFYSNIDVENDVIEVCVRGNIFISLHLKMPNTIYVKRVSADFDYEDAHRTLGIEKRVLEELESAKPSFEAIRYSSAIPENMKTRTAIRWNKAELKSRVRQRISQLEHSIHFHNNLEEDYLKNYYEDLETARTLAEKFGFEFEEEK